MPKRVFFFSDIDDTLMQTRRKTDFSKKTCVGAYNREGEENSFFYEGVKVFLDAILASDITFIPTTARNVDSYQRTILYKEPAIKYAILNFGATVLINNKIDTFWQEKMQQSYKKITPINTIHKELEALLNSDKENVVIKTIDNFYVSIYNKFQLDKEDYLKEIESKLKKFLSTHKEFYLYENTNSFAILPKCLNKKFAVEYLIEKENPILTLGAGDNHSDLDFMNLTSFHLVPNMSDIHQGYR